MLPRSMATHRFVYVYRQAAPGVACSVDYLFTLDSAHLWHPNPNMRRPPHARFPG